MKTKLLTIIVFALLLGNFGCDKDDSNKEELSSIEEEINSIRPINVVSISGDGNLIISYNRGNGSLKDAYATDGYIIIDEGTYIVSYSLSEAELVRVFSDNKQVQLIYF